MKNHSLLECPLYSLTSLVIDSTTRKILSASTEMIQLLDNKDLKGTYWPSKQEQQLCFTTLVEIPSSQRPKRLLTCEHPDMDSLTTIVYCADISLLEKLYSDPSLFHTMLDSSFPSTFILRMNPYGVIQSVFSPSSSSSSSYMMMIGRPLMRFVHNDDIPILCSGLRQLTQCLQENKNDDDFTMISFDLRCNFDSFDLKDMNDRNNDIINNNNDQLNNWKKEYDTIFHFSTVVTGTQDLLCIMRPSATTYKQHTTSSSCSSYLSSLVHSSFKAKHVIHRIHHALWDAVEQGLLMLAHYLAVVMVLALQCYRLARHSSFWLETSELALRCLVAETKSRPELDRVFSWLQWAGLKSSRRVFGSFLDHCTDWLIP
ncbi:uncharacterized protein BX664DRAFT_330922 [Halteromyces radiatus]|uniref:uncharacterized protein n=1 Tax=Halteromyces radiatus TaxID=101107 RepID=UPI00221E6434|nr:uncharacterized protein BX664DRAFT_330922 [Halteromyces radiatus]KAI8093900.1 hypothetical protein BX664DRAFT_330922 [Halteromyces radiatus]